MLQPRKPLWCKHHINRMKGKNTTISISAEKATEKIQKKQQKKYNSLS